MLFLSKASRIAQFGLGIVGMVLGGVLLNHNKSISQSVGELNEISHGLFNVTTPKSTNVLATTSGALTIFDKTGTYAATRVNNVSRFYKRSRGYFGTRFGARFGGVGIPFGTMGYLGGLLGAETTENLMWFGTMSMAMIKNGDGSCGDIGHLLQRYNLTSNSTEDLARFFDPGAGTRGATGTGATAGTGSTESGTDNGSVPLDTSSLDSTTQRNQLLLKLSQNCNMNKGSIAVSVLTYFLYMLTSGMVVNSFVTFRQQYREAEGMLELQYDDPFCMPVIVKMSDKPHDLDYLVPEEEIGTEIENPSIISN